MLRVGAKEATPFQKLDRTGPGQQVGVGVSWASQGFGGCLWLHWDCKLGAAILLFSVVGGWGGELALMPKLSWRSFPPSSYPRLELPKVEHHGVCTLTLLEREGSALKQSDIY